MMIGGKQVVLHCLLTESFQAVYRFHHLLASGLPWLQIVVVFEVALDKKKMYGSKRQEDK